MPHVITIYAGTTTEQGRERHWYVDDKDLLPAWITRYREYLHAPEETPWVSILEAIHQCERDGQRVSWFVGDHEYETP